MKRFLTILSVLFIMAGCLEPYQPPAISNVLGYLVVDGFANTGDGSITVRLSRTTAISSDQNSIGEPGGTVILEQLNSRTFTLQDKGSGNYSLSGLAFSPTAQYRLSIKTKNKSYLSDYITFTTTPPIDSVFYESDPIKSGVQIYVATHDATSKSRYYQWDYVETWKHDAFFPSAYWIQKGLVVTRPAANNITSCWTTVISSKISVTSTEKLGADIVKYPLLFIPKEDLRIAAIHGKYSILVNQHVITSTAYLFWQQLQKTTENLGGLFDPLPNQVVGNMHGPANSTDPVLGYFSGGTIVQKRIFIDLEKLPTYLFTKHEDCTVRELEGPMAPPLSTYPDSYPLVSPSPGATSATGHCIDCRFDGGTTTKPSFWP